MRKLFEFSVKQPLLVNLLTVFIIIVGILSLSRLSRDVFPNVQLDLAIITTSYPGASPEEVEKNVTTPIERELKGVDHIDKLHSFSAENLSTIIIEIDQDAPNNDKVTANIQRAVDNTQNLPEDLPDDPFVQDFDGSFQAVVEISISGDMSEFELTKHAKNLETLLYLEPDIASISRKSWRDEEIWVEIKPESMREHHMSLSELILALKNQNVVIPGGNIIIDGKEVMLRTNGEITNVGKAKKLAVRGNDIGNNLLLKDVANVKRDFAPATTLQRTDGNNSINLVIMKRQRADAIDLVGNIKKAANQYQQLNPDVNIGYINDYSYYVKRRLNVLVSNGWMGIILVLITIFVFMSARSSFVTALGLPIAFLITFFIMDMAGMTINLMTMFALIIVLGMVVDDGIVVAENTFRLREQGMPPDMAAIEGAHAVWKPVTTAVLTTIAAFSPLMTMSGIMGKFVVYIPIIVIIALVASLLEVFIILPSHMAEIERFKKIKWHCNRGWQLKLRNRYKQIMHIFISHRYKVLGGFATILTIATIAFILLPFVLFPTKGIEAFFIRVRTPIGTPIEVTAELLKPIEDIVATLPDDELKNYVMLAGQTGDGAGDPQSENQDNVGQVSVFLTPTSDRSRETVEIAESIREKIENVKGFDETLIEFAHAGPPMGKAIEINVSGQNLNQLKMFSNKIVDYLKTRKGVQDVQIGLRLGKRQKIIEVNQENAARAGITASDIGLAVRTAFEGIRATTIRKGDEEIYIRVRLPESAEKNPDALPNLLIPTKTGQLVPLKNVANIREEQGLLSIRHHQRQRSVLVSANVDENTTTSIKENDLVFDKFKNGATKIGLTLSLGGEFEETSKSLQDLKFAFLGALMLIFIILAFEFQSMTQPFIIMLAIPYGLIGVTLAFALHGEPKSFLALLGAVGLAGIVVNDSIVMVDFINKRIKEGGDKITAIIEASSMRLRAVLLTTLTTVFGLMPVAYGILGYDPFLRPMALTLSWGLMIATMFTLFVTPCVYTIVDDFRSWIHSKTNRAYKKGS